MCSTGCNYEKYEEANPGVYLRGCDCFFECWGSLGPERNGVHEGVCGIPTYLVIAFSVNGALLLAGMCLCFRMRKGRSRPDTKERILTEIDSGSCALCSGTGQVPPGVAAGALGKSTAWARCVRLWTFLSTAFATSPLLFNFLQLFVVGYVLSLPLTTAISAVFVPDDKCRGTTGTGGTAYNDGIKHLILVGACLADLSVITFVLGCIAYVPSIREFPRRQCALGIATLVIAALELAAVRYVSWEYTTANVKAWLLADCAPDPGTTVYVEILNSSTEHAQTWVAIGLTLISMFWARQLHHSSHVFRLVMMPDSARKDAESAVVLAHGWLKEVHRFQEGSPAQVSPNSLAVPLLECDDEDDGGAPATRAATKITTAVATCPTAAAAAPEATTAATTSTTPAATAASASVAAAANDD